MTSKSHAKGLAKRQANAQNTRKRVTPQDNKKDAPDIRDDARE